MSHYNNRNNIFDTLKNTDDHGPTDQIIKVILKDGNEVSYPKYITPMLIAKKLFKKNFYKFIVAKVNGKLYDMNRELETDSMIEFLTFDDPEGKHVFWHSSAHLLGLCCEKLFNCLLEHGPATTDGFFYDMDVTTKLTNNDLDNINALAKIFIEQKLPFERLTVSKENLLQMFHDNPMKKYFINEKIPNGTTGTVYKCGDMVDLCLGPHLPDIGYIKEFVCSNLSSSYWLGDSKNMSLTRIYGISFPNIKKMEEWKKQRADAEARDHRIIGKNQKLFFFHEYSPGSCFFLPHGTRIYNKLVDFIRNEYTKRNFQEVITPNIFNVKLWKTSGHWEHYEKNMFKLTIDENLCALKPMNCPGHCLMYSHYAKSYRDLPLRLADFGVLHRNELHGALTGLTRVRRFQQDDAHIFCKEDDVESEINDCLDFLKHVYGIFGFKFTLALSTRPKSYAGTLEIWSIAEKQLENALNSSGFSWTFNHGDGAFYGPKIDITIEDALGRNHQCATIQLDFNLPNNFDLNYQKSDGTYGRPVMIHRAILGSVERMIAILIENYSGKWPFWLSPRQIYIIPIDPAFNEYANQIYKVYHDAGFYVEVDLSTDKLTKKVRNAQVEQFNFIFVVGEKEKNSNTVNVRTRESKILGTFNHDEVISKLNCMTNTHTNDPTF